MYASTRGCEFCSNDANGPNDDPFVCPYCGHHAAGDLGDDLEVLRVTRRAAGAGSWVTGTLAGHRFVALVFPEHADNPEWELGDSRISKLFIRRQSNRWIVFNWDRGADVPPADELAGQIADFIAGGLADFIYARA